jgi:hypothetical protein
MKSKKSTKVLVMFVVLSVSTSYMVFPQSLKTKASTKTTQIINKLNQDVVLTDKQKATIKIKMDSLALNVQKDGEALSATSELAFSKGIKRICKEIQDSILTPEQVKLLKEKQEKRKNVVVEQLRTK